MVESWGTPVNRGEQGESIFAISQVPIEHHAFLALSHVPWRKHRLTAWIERTMTKDTATRQVMVENMPVRVLSAEIDMVQLGSHNLKHSLNEGIGLRQLCDLALFVCHNQAALAAAPLKDLLSRFGLRRWTDLCLAYCVEHLGLPASKLPYPVKASSHLVEAMHREVMQSGNFGQMDERNISRPTEGRASQLFTARRIARNVWRYISLSPLESLGWAAGLTATRLAGK